MNRTLVSAVTMAALVVTAPAAIAVSQTPAKAPAQAPAQTRVAPGPTVAASTAGIRAAAATARNVTSSRTEPGLGAGRNIALMVVGGTALVVGAIIGGTAGVLLAVGGAVVGLVGLYYFVQ